MTDDLQLAALLRTAMPPVGSRTPARDLWPRLVRRARQRRRWTWLDIGLAAAVAGALFVWPEALLLLAYHF
jgi:hypothetical protein